MTPRDTPNPNATRMPDHLLSLRLPPEPVRGLSATTTPLTTHAAAGSPSPRPASPGLPPASRILTAPRAGLPQGIGLGLGTPVTPGAAIVPGATPATPGSARLPTRRRRVAAETGTPTKVGRGSGYAKAPESDAEDERALPTGEQGGAPPLRFVPPPRAPSSEGGIAHGPPSYRVHRARMREEASDARRARRRRTCVQRVGRASGVEVAFADGPGVAWDEFEEVALDGEAPVGESSSGEGALCVRIHTVDSDSDSDSDTSSGESSTAGRGRSRAPEKGKARELVLPLPADRRALVDGGCALSAAQLREACVFIARVRRASETSPSVSPTPTVATSSAAAGTTAVTTAPPRVRIVSPRGRAEDAMGVAIAYLAYGAQIVASVTMGEGEEGALGHADTTAASSSTSTSISGLPSSTASAPDPSSTSASDPTSAPALPGAARLIEQTASAAGLHTSSSEAGALLRELIETDSDVLVPSVPGPIECWVDDEEYSPAHRLAMRLLDEGDWLARGARPALANGADAGGALGAGRGVVGVVDLQRPARGGLETLDFGGDEEEDEEEDEDMDEEGSAGSTAGSASTLRSRSSAGARVDTGSGASDVDGREARRGRMVAWHGVPMPPKYGGEASASSARTPYDPSIEKSKSKSKSKSRHRRGNASKSKSRVRARSKSALPHAEWDDGREAGVGDEDEGVRAARRAREMEQRRARRSARRARRAMAEEEAYAGLADVWRGVLSHAGLAGLGAVLSAS